MHRLTAPIRTAAALTAAAAVLTALTACTALRPAATATVTITAPTPATALTEPVRVIAVSDGDTIRIAPRDGGKAITVRLAGIDAPETVHPSKPVQCYGPEASAHLKQTLAGQSVQLEYNPAGAGDRTDRYGRTLAYIWQSGQLLNYQLVAAGYARAYTYNPRQPGPHAETLRIAQQQAHTAGRGLWNPGGCNGRI
ncbi:thermonuclease family protein [Tsukamurella strandjordii]|uniref:thermonuclease family protein n=1 Tax=Tsukamurella strandjordii TaxID=147577 RepID=UPI0031D90820